MLMLTLEHQKEGMNIHDNHLKRALKPPLHKREQPFLLLCINKHIHKFDDTNVSQRCAYLKLVYTERQLKCFVHFRILEI